MGHSLRYEVNCSILFTELPLLQRPGAAKAAGFDAVEFWWPFAAAVPSDSDVDAFVRSIDDAGVQLAGLNFFAGDMLGGDTVDAVAVERVEGAAAQALADADRDVDVVAQL